MGKHPPGPHTGPSPKHTPGPWHAFQTADSTRHLVVQGDGSRPNEPIIATVIGHTASLHAAEASNARLIAAAPELLEVLLAVEWSGTEETEIGDSVGACPWCGNAQADDHTAACKLAAAIAKAEGGGA